MTTVKIKVLSDSPDDHALLMPKRQTEGAAGYDLVAAEDVLLTAGVPVLVKCGFAMELPEGWEAQVRPRSSLLFKYKVHVAFGTIDADYRGEVGVVMIFMGTAIYQVKRGDRIAQMVVSPVHRVDLVASAELSETARGTGGFGSTGKGSTVVVSYGSWPCCSFCKLPLISVGAEFRNCGCEQAVEARLNLNSGTDS